MPLEPWANSETGVEELRWSLGAEVIPGPADEVDWYKIMRSIFVNVLNLGLACDTRVQL